MTCVGGGATKGACSERSLGLPSALRWKLRGHYEGTSSKWHAEGAE